MCTLRRAVIGIVVTASCTVAAAQSNEEARERAKASVVMLRTQLPSGSAVGAGLVVAASAEQVYVITARHLLREPTGMATSVQVQFSSRPGEWFPGQVLDRQDQALDLGAIVIRPPATIAPARLAGVAAGGLSLRRGADVYPLGFPREQPWRMAVSADKVEDTTGTKVLFQSQLVRPGHSGGALLDACGRVVGMVTVVDPPDAEAIRIDTLLDTVKSWALPVTATLSISSNLCGSAPPLLRNPGFESVDVGLSPSMWVPNAWNPKATITTDTIAYEGSRSAKLATTIANDIAWKQAVNIEPNTDYILSGWIKTIDVVATDSVQTGASLSIFEGFEHSLGVIGTADWTFQKLQFNSGSRTRVDVACRLGYFSGLAHGTAWCDDLKLEKINSAP